MKTVETYQAPQVEVIEVEVEQGFAASARVGDWTNGEHLGNHEAE